MAIPSQCPECGQIAIEVFDVPPYRHERSEDWETKAVCNHCGEYESWF